MGVSEAQPFHQYSHPHWQETREKMSVSQLDLWVREVVEERGEERREGRKEGREGGRGRTCLDVALRASLRLAPSPPCRNLSIERVRSKDWAIRIPAEDEGYAAMVESTTLGAGRQVATPRPPWLGPSTTTTQPRANGGNQCTRHKDGRPETQEESKDQLETQQLQSPATRSADPLSPSIPPISP